MIKLEKGPLIMGPWSSSTFQVIHANTLRSGPFRGRERERERSDVQWGFEYWMYETSE